MISKGKMSGQPWSTVTDRTLYNRKCIAQVNLKLKNDSYLEYTLPMMYPNYDHLFENLSTYVLSHSSMTSIPQMCGRTHLLANLIYEYVFDSKDICCNSTITVCVTLTDWFPNLPEIQVNFCYFNPDLLPTHFLADVSFLWSLWSRDAKSACLSLVSIFKLIFPTNLPPLGALPR